MAGEVGAMVSEFSFTKNPNLKLKYCFCFFFFGGGWEVSGCGGRGGEVRGCGGGEGGSSKCSCLPWIQIINMRAMMALGRSPEYHWDQIISKSVHRFSRRSRLKLFSIYSPGAISFNRGEPFEQFL